MEFHRPSTEAQKAAKLEAEKADQAQYEKEFYGLEAQLAEIDHAVEELVKKNDSSPEGVEALRRLKNRRLGVAMKQDNLKIRHTERQRPS